jgi:hypothetical protein
VNAPVALKEWAAICAALEAGRQTILLRKGGLIEKGETFAVEHPRFWLYPTYLHQQEQGVAEEHRPFLSRARSERPAAGTVRLSLLAEVAVAWQITTAETALALGDLHAWTPETISSRFEYRTPGLTLLLLRVYRAGREHTITETAEQVGCRSWVPLVESLDPSGTTPVLGDAVFAKRTEDLLARLSLLGGATEVLRARPDAVSA